MDKIKKFFAHPPLAFLAIGSLLSLIAVFGSLGLVVSDNRKTFWAIIVYSLAFAGLLFIVYSILEIRNRVKSSFAYYIIQESSWFKGNDFYLAKTKALSILSIFTNLAYAIFCLVLYSLSNSLYYIFFFVLYMLIPAMKGTTLYLAHSVKKERDPLRKTIDSNKIMGIIGLILGVIDIAFIIPLVLLLTKRSFLSYSNILIFVSMAYALTRIIITICSFVKAQRSNDPIAISLRSFSYVSLLASIFSLVLGLCTTFFEKNAILLYSLTGAFFFVSLMVIALWMAIKGFIGINKAKAQAISLNKEEIIDIQEPLKETDPQTQNGK